MYSHALDSRMLLDCALMCMEIKFVNTLAMSVGLEGSMREACQQLDARRGMKRSQSISCHSSSDSRRK